MKEVPKEDEIEIRKTIKLIYETFHLNKTGLANGCYACMHVALGVLTEYAPKEELKKAIYDYVDFYFSKMDQD